MKEQEEEDHDNEQFEEERNSGEFHETKDHKKNNWEKQLNGSDTRTGTTTTVILQETPLLPLPSPPVVSLLPSSQESVDRVASSENNMNKKQSRTSVRSRGADKKSNAESKSSEYKVIHNLSSLLSLLSIFLSKKLHFIRMCESSLLLNIFLFCVSNFGRKSLSDKPHCLHHVPCPVFLYPHKQRGIGREMGREMGRKRE